MASIDKISTSITRRTFLAGSVKAGLFMSFGGLLAGCTEQEAADKLKMPEADLSKIFSPAVWFNINAQGAVTINIAKAEMGQHVGTALARVVADELGADWGSVQIEHVDTDPKWGYMVTGGSWSVFTSFKQLSQAGAAGREVLLDAGAALMGVDRTNCSADGGRVTSGDQSVSFADIVTRGDISRTFTQEQLDALPIKPASQRTLIGKQSTALDIPAKSRGEAVYGIDAELPGMVYATPLMPPTRYGSKINSIDDAAAKEIAGYQQTLQITDPSDHLQGWAVVIASSFPAALKAAAAIKVDWAAGNTAQVSEADIFSAGEALVRDNDAGALVVDDGDVATARDSAPETLEAMYRTNSVLHFALEPVNTLVEFSEGKCHIHSGNQWQSLVLPTLSAALELPETDIIIHQYYLGGGFGRRLWGDYMIPAALAAKQLGKPVKMLWQRVDDSRLDCVRSPSVQIFKASIDADKKVTGIEHAAAAGWPTLTLAPGFLADGQKDSGKYDTFSISGADHWYTLANHRVRAINNDLAQKTFLPGWLRAVGPGWVAWGVESFMDELAVKNGRDAIEFRLSMLDGAGKNAGKAPEAVGGAERLAAVLKDVRDRSSWGAELPNNEGFGVAVGSGQERTMPTWTAIVAHVSVNPDTNAVTVKKIWQTIDCGTVVHPDGAMAQAEGATLWGVSLALHEGTQFENGQVKDRNLDTYRPMRMSQVPELDITFMPSEEFPTGLGEPPLIAVAPAIANAVFAATNKRVRDLPIRLS